MRKIFVWAGRLLLLLYFVVASIILVGRHFILPEIDAYRGSIEEKLSAAIGLPVRIEALSATWPGFHPRLTIRGLQLMDREGQLALAFERVEAEIGWASLWHSGLRLYRLEIHAPVLDLRRDTAGVLHIAGLPLTGNGDNGFADWLLVQGRIDIRDARLVWRDELRAAPPFELQHLDFELRNGGRHHSFGLTAEPSGQVAGRIDLRGNLIGKNPADLASWRGELFADLEQVDLAAWRTWVETPLELSRGKGGMRLWLNFDKLQLAGITTDMRLDGLSLRLQPDLSALALRHLDGRSNWRRTEGGFVVELKQFSLATEDGIEVRPVDGRLALNFESGHESGELRANALDLGALSALARHLPLPDQLQAQLKNFASQGRLAGLELSWRGKADAPTHWEVKSRFEGLALAAYQALPGFAGLAGRLEGDDRAGKVHVDSAHATLDLPTIFVEPQLPLTSLVAEVGWEVRGDGANRQVDLLLDSINFHNADAAGEISGRYRHTGKGPGEIDLSARLTQGNGDAVWRYIPLVVGEATRDWLRTGILAGRSDNTTLRLKGPLEKFPFRDGKDGIFQVKGTFQGGRLNYVNGWPEIIDVDGDLLFEGVRMLIHGKRGTLMEVGLSDVKAEIADLGVMEEILTITGQAKGPTQKFLDFIEASPVGGMIDHFTETMTASGKGELDLKLVLPLRHIDRAKVDGRYRFADNQVHVLPVLPVFTQAQGDFGFTADRLQAKNLKAGFMGMPVTADITSAAGGTVRVSAAGSLTAQALRQEYGWRALDHLSGQTPWRATVTVRKPGADVRIDSTLEGISSSLPEPFNKSALEVRPLRVDGRIEPKADRWKATLGNNAGSHASLDLVQAAEGLRGQVVIGAPSAKSVAPAVAANGIALVIAQPKLDVDRWRSVLETPNAGRDNDKSSPLLAAIDVKVPDVFLLGRDFHDVYLAGTRNGPRWRFALDSREAQGQINWDGTGAGRVTARLARFILPAAAGNALPSESASEQSRAGGPGDREMPAIDLAIDNFRLHDKALGEVRVLAENRDGAWQARLDVKNDAATLHGAGRWRPHSGAGAAETALNFKLEVEDAEKLLGRMGLPDAIRRGEAKLEGDVSWAGSPFALDIPSLSGQLRLEAEKGQFKKLEPGVGRLLGVLSLQSLPRRITLDFRDIFSEGFAFDSIAGTAKVNRGQMQTDLLSIRGPAAKVLLSGKANLVAETQDIKVRVQPAVGESIAVGAMIANPVVGAVAWAAQKVLNDPLDQMFAFEYAVTGSWDDPKVEKISGNAPASPPNKSQELPQQPKAKP